MPFTPFHFGVGALLKAVGGDRFSFTIFAGSQVVMDVEPLVRILRHDAVLHGSTHTAAGAFALAIGSAALGQPIVNWTLPRLGLRNGPVSWPVAFATAFIGTYSHVIFDAVMHRDVRPGWPVTDANLLLGAITVPSLHAICIGSGIIGGAVMFARAWRSA